MRHTCIIENAGSETDCPVCCGVEIKSPQAKMNSRVDLLFVQLAEEAAEIAQEAAKCLRFGSQEIYPAIGISNAERVKAEINDLLGVVEMLQEEGALPLHILSVDMIRAKKEKVEINLKYSIKCGRMQE